MKTKEIIKTAREIAKPFRITKGKDFRLKDVDPNDFGIFRSGPFLQIDGTKFDNHNVEFRFSGGRRFVLAVCRSFVDHADVRDAVSHWLDFS